MDLIGALGYAGQNLFCLGGEKIGFHNGTGIVAIQDGAPTEMIPHASTGVSAIATHLGTHHLAIAPCQILADIDVLDLNTKAKFCSLANPTSGFITDMAFSHDGERLIGMSDVADHRVIMWDAIHGNIIFNIELPVCFRSVLINPGDATMFCCYGDEGLYVGHVTEIMGESNVRFEKIDLYSEKPPVDEEADGELDNESDEIVAISQGNSIGFACWAPNNVIYAGTGQGILLFCNLTTKTIKIVSRVCTYHQEGDGGHSNISGVNNISCGLLTATDLVVGTTEGLLLWYPVDALHDLLANNNVKPEGQPAATGNVLEVQEVEAMQVARLRRYEEPSQNISTILINHSYTHLHVGSRVGAIYKFPVEIARPVSDEEQINKEVADDGSASHDAPAAAVEIESEPYCNFHEGAVLCSLGIFLPVVRVEDGITTKHFSTTLSLFLTGSHLGCMTCWQTPPPTNEFTAPVAVSPRDDDKTIRQAVPSLLKVMYRMRVEAAAPDFIDDDNDPGSVSRLSTHVSEVTPAITCMEVLATTSSTGGRLLGVGTSNGYLEVWMIQAVEDDEAEDEGDGGDDEEGSSFKVIITKLFRRHLYRTPISILRASTSRPIVAIGSMTSREMYILSTANVSHFEIACRLTLPLDHNSQGNLSNHEEDEVLPEEWQPVNCIFKDESLWVVARNGCVLMYNQYITMHNIQNARFNYNLVPPAPLLCWDTAAAGASCCICDPQANMLVLADSNKSAFAAFAGLPKSAPVADHTADLMSPVDLLNLPSSAISVFADDFQEYGDVILCGAVSLSGNFMALGGADGVIHNYKIEYVELPKAAETEAEGEGESPGSPGAAPAMQVKYTCLHRVQLHRSAVLSLAFSVDSSLVLSSAADGTCFIYALDKIHVPRSDPIQQFTPRMEDSDIMRLAENESTSFGCSIEPLFIEKKREMAAEAVRLQNEEKTAEIVEAVDALAERLNEILVANDEAPSLEKMDSSEFVVDLMGKQTIIQANHNEVEQIREQYHTQNMFNELVAARIRQSYWDTMEHQSAKLLPIQPPETSSAGNTHVTSFSVKMWTDKEKQLYERTRTLRSVEVRSQKTQMEGKIQFVNTTNARAVWSTSVTGIPTNVDWIAFDGQRWPCMDVVEMLLQKEQKEAEAAKAQTGKEGAPPVEAASGVVDVAVEEDYGEEDDAKAFDDTNVFNLLYPPTAVRTHIQKRYQIIFMKEVARLIRLKFNEHFDKLISEKEDAISAVEARNQRIAEIYEELHTMDNTLLKPVWHDEEVAGSAIVVKDGEIESRPYENEKTRAKRLQEEEDRRREREKDKDDVRGRALEDMMHGTLEVKKDLLNEANALQRPAWMEEISPENFTETQRKEFDEFEARLKEIQEETAKYRKALEQEVKRLKAEIADTCKSFDDKILWLSRFKMLTQKEIFAVELYICRMSLSMTKTEQAMKTIKRIEDEVEETRRQRNKLREKLDKFSTQVNTMHAHLQQLQEDSMTMDKGFKRDIQTLCSTTFDQDALKQLSALYRRRHYPEDAFLNDSDEDDGAEAGAESAGEHMMSSKGGRASHGGHGKQSQRGSNKKSSMKAGGASMRQSKARRHSKSGMSSQKQSSASGSRGDSHLGPMQALAQEALGEEKPDDLHMFNEHDPFCMVLMQKLRVQRLIEAQIPIMDVLSMEMDCPENLNIDQYAWSKLTELRSARIAKEIEVKQLSASYGEMKKKLDDMTLQDGDYSASITALKTQRDETVRQLNRVITDIEIVVALKQGQDEVDKDAVVTDYSEALLLPVNVVDKYNSRILELGKEKIAVLNKIKQFRRKINLVGWEAVYMRMEATHLEEYYTDLQLFRVTRDLQQVIRGGINNAEQVKERIDRVQTRKDFLSKDSEAKLNKLRRLQDQCRLQNEERLEENFKLEKKIIDLRRQVEERDKVRQSRKESQGLQGDPAASAMLKMKKVVARRQLVDTARAQAEEIDFLRQELDKFRQKTFPSFLRATRTRLAANPDEQY